MINSRMRLVGRHRTHPSPPCPMMASHPTRMKAYMICRRTWITPVSYFPHSSTRRPQVERLDPYCHLSRSMPFPHLVRWVDPGARVVLRPTITIATIDLLRSRPSLHSTVSRPCQLVHSLPSKLHLSHLPRGVYRRAWARCLYITEGLVQRTQTTPLSRNNLLDRSYQGRTEVLPCRS